MKLSSFGTVGYENIFFYSAEVKGVCSMPVTKLQPIVFPSISLVNRNKGTKAKTV